MQNLYLISEVAKKAGCQIFHVEYAIKTGKIKEPIRIGGRRVFDDQEVKFIINYFKKRREYEQAKL